jgi:hypothetical protein
MLSVTEIQKRIQSHPEPPEVNEIRQHILSEFKDLVFVPSSHTYYVKRGRKKVDLRSVSATVKLFESEADWDDIAEKFALNHDMDVDVVKDMWKRNADKACTLGTVVHEYGEMWHHLLLGKPDDINDRFKIQLVDGYFYPVSPKQEAVAKFNEDLFNVDSMYSVLAETMVYDEELGYAGTFDKLVYYKHPTDDSKSGLVIMDYKTNGTLYNDYNESKDIRMKKPFDYMIDCAYSHYIVQQSLYQIPIEKLGYKVLARKLIWVKPDETYEKINCTDVTKILIETLKK